MSALGVNTVSPSLNTKIQTFSVLTSRDGAARKSIALDKFRGQGPDEIDALMSRDLRALVSCIPCQAGHPTRITEVERSL